MIIAILTTLIIQTYGGHNTVVENLTPDQCADQLSVARYGVDRAERTRQNAIIAAADKAEREAHPSRYETCGPVVCLSSLMGTVATGAPYMHTSTDISDARCAP